MSLVNLLALAIVAISAVALVVFSAQLVRAVARRSHAAYGMERSGANQAVNVVALRWAFSLVGLLAGLLLVVSPLNEILSSRDDGGATSGSVQPGAVIYYVSSPTPPRVVAAIGVASPPTSTPPPAPTTSAPTSQATGAATAQPISTQPAPTPSPALTARPTATRPAITPSPRATPTSAAPTVALPLADCADPGSAGIISPAHGEVVSGQKPVIVNAGVREGEYAKLEVLNHEGTWAFVAGTSAGIKNGAIGTINSAAYAPGVRQVRLMIVDATQHEAKLCRIAVVLR